MSNASYSQLTTAVPCHRWQGTQCSGENGGAALPAGWRVDEQGRLRRETIHRMTRRCLNWDYCGTGVYMITLVLNDRSRPLFGRLVGASGETAAVEPSELGARIAAHFRRLPEFTSEIEVLGFQLMPEHLHAVIRVVRRMKKPLGEQLRGFKIGASKIARELGAISAIDGREQGRGIGESSRGIGEVARGVGEAARGRGLFADGFVDTILGDEAAVSTALAYLADNPRRLWEKRAHPELFKVLRDYSFSAIDGRGKSREFHFAAIGNQALLRRPHLLQIQVSRRDFAYRRSPEGEPIKTAPYALSTAAFEEKAAISLAAAAHGAVLVSPCISEGEKEIAARAHAAGFAVVTLANKGFSPLYKPGGELFDCCAAGNLLLLAPAAWPYLPGKKPMTRLDACVLNRIAQLLAGDGAVEINYKGYDPGDVDQLVEAATVAVA